MFHKESSGDLQLFTKRGEVDSLQEADQDAVTLVELGVAFLADKFRQSGVTVQPDPDQSLEVGVERQRRLGRRGVRLVVYDVDGIPSPVVEGVPQTPRGELPVAQPAQGRGQSTCGHREQCLSL